MKKIYILARPARISNVSFDDLYYEISHDWQRKAQDLRARRWRSLRRALKIVKPSPRGTY